MMKGHKENCKCAFCPGRVVWQDPAFREKHKKGLLRAAKEGKLSYWQNNEMSEEHKQNIKKGLIIAGKEGKLSRWSKEKLPPNLKIAQAASPFQKGEKNLRWNPNYQHAYGTDFTWKLKKEIRDRDNNCCTSCFSSKNVVVHHIDENKENNSKKNLISLCRSCHLRVHHKSIVLNLKSSLITVGS